MWYNTSTASGSFQSQRWPEMADLPPNIRKNLDFFLDHEPEDPDRFGPLILALSERWGI
jgi:hypothetical protein